MMLPFFLAIENKTSKQPCCRSGCRGDTENLDGDYSSQQGNQGMKTVSSNKL